MKESYWKETPALSSKENCANELIRLNSGSSSLSVANFKNTLLQSENAATDKCTGWTNEKHNKFLDYLEASFVKQLHRSMALRAGSVEMNLSYRNLLAKLSAHFDEASEQLPFLHYGCWKKIKTVRKPSFVYIAADFDDCLKYLCGDAHHQVLDSQFCCELHCKGKQMRDERSSSCEHKTRSHLILSNPGVELQKIVCRVTEGSGQNFMDEDFDKNSSCKKMKTASVDTTDQEQVIPTSSIEITK